MNETPGTAPGAHIGDDEFIDLVSGFLDDASRARVIAHASACAHCDARFREISATHERGLARAAEALREPADEPRVHPFWRPSVALLAVASFIVVAAAVFLARPQPPPAPPCDARPRAVWLPSAVSEGIRRSGGASQAESLVIAGVQAYGRRDLAEAERLLRAPLIRSALDKMRRLYFREHARGAGAQRGGDLIARLALR
ncbi:MAG: hypothetical protein IPJ04_15560 [Candidatus Eisenbacteria bacterium]|nr:hypothetical protein [Candidatus Eisenbacteria bacterium]